MKASMPVRVSVPGRFSKKAFLSLKDFHVGFAMGYEFTRLSGRRLTS
jgi:hypothetical protein